MTVYLDHAATSPMPATVRQAFVEALAVVGNPSSIHSAGQGARAVLDDARARIAATLGVDAVELTLTGGGTEAVNTGVKGLYWRRQRDAVRAVILMTSAEHHATLDAVDWLVAHAGAELVTIPVDPAGRMRITALEESLVAHGDRVALVTMLAANNEVGTLQPVIIDHLEGELAIGRSRFDAPEIDGLVQIQDGEAMGVKPGDIVNVRILGSDEHDLFGLIGPGEDEFDD